MNVGWIGLGKLGLTCAAVLADRGHQVVGHDVGDWAARVLAGDADPPHEDGFTDLDVSRLKLVDDVSAVVAASDVVFVAVQTPHAPAYGGETLAPDDRRDFEYGYLVAACREVCRQAHAQNRVITLAVVSTVLPGTCDRLIRPLLGTHVRLVYNPFFIAMGTTVADFLRPEFVLLGVDRREDAALLRGVYAALHQQPRVHMSIASAELTKVAYNTFISMKIVWANAVMEICHHTGADVDQVVDALALATDRVISPAYLRGGMGDGGHCHPRDLIAMSWLAQRLDLSYDLLGQMTTAREAQSQWLADLVWQWCDLTRLTPVVLGRSYKPESPLTGGSPALLLYDQLAARLDEGDGWIPIWDPHVDGAPVRLPDRDLEGAPALLADPHVFVVAARHPEFVGLSYPCGSVVIDPWGYIPDRTGVTVVRIGRKS